MKTEAIVATESSLVQASGRKSAETALPRIVTTSWDDGDPLDLRVATLLAERHIPATFYISLKSHVDAGHRACPMSLDEMRALDAQGFEIGAHGVSHPNLAQCPSARLAVEVESSKKRLEDDLGKSVSMFAYPRGRHNANVIAAVKRAGYTGARTTAMMGRQLTFDPFRMPTSLQVYPHTRLDYFRNLGRAWDIRRSWFYATHLRCARNWIELAKTLFDSVRRGGGVWHLYGHSWEIEEFKLWGGLEEVLDYVAHQPGVAYLTNGDTVQMRRNALTCVSYAPQPITR